MTNIEVDQARAEQHRIFARICLIFAEACSLHAEMTSFKYLFHPIQLNRLVKQHQALEARHLALSLEHREAIDRVRALRRKNLES